jgi:multisubunit Na+/H+ antiporter MnhB subunit
MKWVYIAAGIALFVKFLIMPNPAPDLSFSIVQALVQDSGVPNAVTAVILRNRLYDTIFEVVVFTIAVMGAKFLLADERPFCAINQFTDQPSIVMARLGATIAAMVGIELAIRGHLSPAVVLRLELRAEQRSVLLRLPHHRSGCRGSTSAGTLLYGKRFRFLYLLSCRLSL